MDYKLLKKIPSKYRIAIRDIYKDEDGYWCCINKNNFKLENYYADYTIHEDTFQEVLNVIKQSLKKIN